MKMTLSKFQSVLYKVCLLIWVGLLMPNIVLGQSDPEDYKTRAIHLNTEDASYQFHILNQPVEIKVSDNVDYYWYKGDKIHHNEGAYSGLPLDGKFEKYDLEGHLIELGWFEEGVKEGVWKKWNKHGDLIELNKWKNGTIQERRTFTSSDHLIEKLTYKDGKLDGKCLRRSGGKDTIIHYKDGEPYTPFFRRIKRGLFSSEKEDIESDSTPTNTMEGVNREKTLQNAE